MERNLRPSRLLGLCLIGALSVPLSLHATPAAAYKDDTHFTMTYVICRLVGFRDDEALLVASIDQGLDDSPATNAVPSLKFPFPSLTTENEILWHAIPVDGEPFTVMTRLDRLWHQAVKEGDTPSALMRLGVVFHYQQDVWAHRHHPNAELWDFEPYKAPVGHAAEGDQPDFPPFDPLCALRCLEGTMYGARAFLQVRLGRTSNPLFDNYQPDNNATIDENWPRKGLYFNQLAPGTGSDAEKLLANLIRAQIEAYLSSVKANPTFFLRMTADEADNAVVADSINRLLAPTGIAAPVIREKIEGLTTPMLKQLMGESP